MRRFACWLAYRVGVEDGEYGRYWKRRTTEMYGHGRLEIEQRGQKATAHPPRRQP